ncbi:fimbrial protein HofN [Citrobacter koseri]|nr:fimbrial protein HofN [Citrobacter koseri]
MSHPVNFLPWRQSRRRECLRFWSVMFSGSLLLTIALACIHEVTLTAQKRVDAQWSIAEKERAAALLAIQPRLQQRQTAWQQALQRQTEYEQTRRWQSVLEGMAALLPEQAWLTRLSWQQGTLELEGYATTFLALNTLETALRRHPDFLLAGSGQRSRMRRDAGNFITR